MFRILHHTHFEFMKYRRFWLVLSTAINMAALVLIFVKPGFKYGVDFAGGTQVTVKFKSSPDLGRIRSALEGLNLGTVTIQRFDEAERNELLLRVQNPGQEGDFSATTSRLCIGRTTSSRLAAPCRRLIRRLRLSN